MSPEDIIARAKRSGRRLISEADAKAMLRAYGVNVPRNAIIHEAQDVAEAVAALNMPCVLKIISPDVSHKSDIGGVRLNLRDAAAIVGAMTEMQRLQVSHKISIEGFLLEEMVPKGHEMVVGGTVDKKFGPVLMIGLGGIFVEVLSDVIFRLCPIDRADAHDMLQELRGFSVLSGARGGIAVDMTDSSTS